MPRPSYLILLLVGLVACGSSSPAATPAPTTVTPAASGDQAPSPSVVEPDARRVCARDEDCQLVPSCDCLRCVASKQMDVEPCPSVCATSPCAGQLPGCASGQCVAVAVPPTGS